MNILIDADGCPVVDLTLQIAKRFGVPVIILCDTSHQIEREGAQTLVFDKGADSVDFALVNRVKPGDVVVTQDYGLASMCLAKCARVLNQNGMEYSSCRSNLLKGLLYCRIRCRKIKNENTAEMPCAINVARAAPNTPKPSPATIQRSIKIFRMEEKISRPSGILDSPMEVNMVERMLYMNKNGKPTK